MIYIPVSQKPLPWCSRLYNLTAKSTCFRGGGLFWFFCGERLLQGMVPCESQRTVCGPLLPHGSQDWTPVPRLNGKCLNAFTHWTISPTPFEVLPLWDWEPTKGNPDSPPPQSCYFSGTANISSPRKGRARRGNGKGSSHVQTGEPINWLGLLAGAWVTHRQLCCQEIPFPALLALPYAIESPRYIPYATGLPEPGRRLWGGGWGREGGHWNLRWGS